MTQASSLLSKLRQPIDAVQKALSLSSAYARSDAAENVRATRAACEKELETLSILEKSGATLQAKDQVAKISAYLHNYNEKSQALTRTAEAILDEYESTLSNAKIAMELNYKISKVELMRDNIASALQLENVVPIRDIQNRVKLATAAIRELKDIKALVAEKVDGTDTMPVMFKGIVDLFVSDPLFQHHLSNLFVDPRVRYNPCTVRLELIRSVKTQVSALDAGYTNLSCSATFKLLNKAIAEIHALHDHWFGSTSRISGDRSRMREVHREIANVLYSGDQSKFPNLALTRFDRIEMAIFLVLEVFCPIITFEVQSFTNTLDQLAAHQHLDERATAKVANEGFQVKKSEIEAHLDDNIRYLEFAQTKNPNYHPHYVPKALGRLYSTNEALIEDTETTTSMFNKTDSAPISPRKLNGLYSLDRLASYMANWGRLFQGYNDWFSSMTYESNKTMVNWETFVADHASYQKLEQDTEQILKELDLTLNYNWNNIVSPMRVESAVRAGLDQVDLKTDMTLDLNSQDKQKELCRGLLSVLDARHETRRILKNIHARISTFPEARDHDPENLRAFYSAVNAFIQFSDWFDHDRRIVNQIYRENQ